MTQKLYRVCVWAGIAGATLFQTSCVTDLRDAVVTGAFDFIAGTTTELLTGLLPLPQVLFPG